MVDNSNESLRTGLRNTIPFLYNNYFEVPTFNIEQFLHSTAIERERIPSYVKFLAAWPLGEESDLTLLNIENLENFEAKYKLENKDFVLLDEDRVVICEAAQSYIVRKGT